MQTDGYEGKMRKGKMWTGKRRTDRYERVYADMTVKCGSLCEHLLMHKNLRSFE